MTVEQPRLAEGARNGICWGTTGPGKMQVMKTVAVFLSDDTTVRRLVLLFRGRCSVEAFGDVKSAREVLARGDIRTAVVDLRRRAKGATPMEST